MYLYRAGAAVDGWWKPVDSPIAVNQDVDIESHIKLTVITVEIDKFMHISLTFTSKFYILLKCVVLM